MKEVLEASIVYSSDSASLKKLELESEAVLARLKSPIAVELSARLGSLKQTKAELLNQISDLQKELKLQLKMEIQNPARIGELRSQLGGLRGEADMLGKVINRQNQNLNNFANTGSTELSKLGYYFQKLGIDINSGLGQKLTGITQILSGSVSKGLSSVGGSAIEASNGVGALGLSLGLIGKVVGFGAIASGLYNIGSASLTLADNLEQNEIAFSTMLGSGEKATQLLADLSAFASKTPFELTGIRQNAKQLLAMGIASDDLIPTMKALGDVSAGLSVPLDRLALAYGQVIAKGKLQGGELKQFTEAGVPLIATISKTLGVTAGEFYKMVEAGKISADEVVKAFQTMSGEGGQFNNLMIKQSQTMSGMWSNFRDQLALTGETIGTALLPAMKGIISAMSALLGFFTGERAGAVYSFIAKIGELLYTISGLKIAVSVLAFTFEGLYNLFKAFMPVIDDIATSISTMLDTAIQLTKEFGDFFSQTMSDITGSAKESTDAQARYWEYVTAFITVAWINLIGLIQGTFTTLGQGLGAMMDYFGDKTNFTTEKMKGLFIGTASAIANTVLGIVNNTINLILVPINAAIAGLNKLKDLGNSVGGSFKKTEFITASFSVGDGQGVFQKAGGKILSGLESLGNNVSTAVEAKTQQMLDKQTKSTTAIVKNNTVQSKSYGGVADAIAKGSKKGSDAAKEAADKQKKYYSDLISKRKENIKSLDTEIKKLKDGVKEIEAIEKKMQDLTTGAKGQTGDVVASRYRTLLEEQKTLEQDLLQSQNETAGTAFLPDPTIQKNLDDTLAQIKEIENSGLLDQNTKAKEQQRASLTDTGQERFDFQEALADIELKKTAEMEALKAEKIAVEARLGMKADEATKELALLETRKSQNERQLKAYEDITKMIEKGITDATKQNIDARMVEYRREEAKLNDLIRLRMMAGMSIPTPVAPVTNNNVTNAPTVNVNAQVSQNVDVNYIGQELSRQLLLSNKGIN